MQYLHWLTSKLANLLTQLIYSKTKSPQIGIPLFCKAWNMPVLFISLTLFFVGLTNSYSTCFPPKLIQFPGLSKTFFHFFQDFLHQSSRTFPELSTKFQDFPGFLRSYTNSNNKISFLQNKNIQPVVYINNSPFCTKNKNKYFSWYILPYRSYTPENWSFIRTYWLKTERLKVISEHDSLANTIGSRAVTSGLFSFLWDNIRKISIGNWLPFISLQMCTAHVYQTECFQNKTAWTQTMSENEMHAYWYNLNTNNQS